MLHLQVFNYILNRNACLLPSYFAINEIIKLPQHDDKQPLHWVSSYITTVSSYITTGCSCITANNNYTNTGSSYITIGCRLGLERMEFKKKSKIETCTMVKVNKVLK